MNAKKRESVSYCSDLWVFRLWNPHARMTPHFNAESNIAAIAVSLRRAQRGTCSAHQDIVHLRGYDSRRHLPGRVWQRASRVRGRGIRQGVRFPLFVKYKVSPEASWTKAMPC